MFTVWSTCKCTYSIFVSDADRLKKPQPDNYEGLKAGKLDKVSDPVGLTVDGLQEWHDEACLAVLNNKYGDGITWHDVSCHHRYIVHYSAQKGEIRLECVLQVQDCV